MKRVARATADASVHSFIAQVSYGQGYYGTHDFLAEGVVRYRKLMDLMGSNSSVFLARAFSSARPPAYPAPALHPVPHR